MKSHLQKRKSNSVLGGLLFGLICSYPLWVLLLAEKLKGMVR